MPSQLMHRGDLVAISGGVPMTAVIEGYTPGIKRVPVRHATPLASDQVLWYEPERVGLVHCPHAVLAPDSWVLKEPQWVWSRVDYEYMPFGQSHLPGEKDWRVRIAEPKWSILPEGSSVTVATVFPAFGQMQEVTNHHGEIMAVISKVRAGTWHVSVTGCGVALVPSPRMAYQLIFGWNIRLQPNPAVDDRPLAELGRRV